MEHLLISTWISFHFLHYLVSDDSFYDDLNAIMRNTVAGIVRSKDSSYGCHFVGWGDLSMYFEAAGGSSIVSISYLN